MVKENKNIVVSSVLWKLLERFSVQFTSFFVSIVLARILMPEEYGVIAIILVFLNIADVIIDGGLNTALIQKKDADDKDFSTIFIFSMLIAAIMYLVLFLSAPFIAEFYHLPILTKILRILGLTLFIFVFNSIQRAYVAKHMLFKKLFYSSFASVCFSGVIGVILAVSGYGVWALVAQCFVNQLTTSVVMWFTVNWRPIVFFSVEKFKSLFSYGWKIFVTNLIITVFDKLRTMVVGKLYSAESLAFYDRGNQFSNMIIGNINTSIQNVLFPVLSSSQEDTIRFKTMMRRATQTSCLCIFPITIALIVMSDSIVRLLLTEKWIEAVPFIRILCLASLFKPLSLSNLEAIKALGHSGVVLKLEVIKTILNIIIIVITCFISLRAIAWGMVVFNVLCVFINLYPNYKFLNYSIKEQISDVLPMLLLSIMMGFCIFVFGCLNLNLVLSVIFQILLGILIYAMECWLFKVESYIYLKDMIFPKIKLK